MGKRRLARETVLQALYLTDVSRTQGPDALAGILLGLPNPDSELRNFCLELLEGTLLHRKELDQVIQDTADNWALERMTAIDRNILRLASYELLHHAETPVGVVIDEALEIAKKFSSEKSVSFINGILDKIKNRRPAEPKKS